MVGVHHKPNEKTKKLVADLVLHGLSQAEIAKRLSICVETLVSHYYYEIYELKHDVNCEIENIALEKARKGDWKAIKLWLQCKGGWAAARPLEQIESEKDQKSLIEKIFANAAGNQTQLEKELKVNESTETSDSIS